MNLIQLFWTFLNVAPTNNFVAFDAAGQPSHRVSFVLCQQARFESVIKTTNTYTLQIAMNTNGGWENFGTPITGWPGADPITNIQVLSVPSTNINKGPVFFRLSEIPQKSAKR